MSINKTLKKALNNSSIDINLVVTSGKNNMVVKIVYSDVFFKHFYLGSVFPLTSINIQINCKRKKSQVPCNAY